MVASVEHAFQYSHIQCDGLCIMNTVVYGCICGACFPILTFLSVMDGILYTLLYMVASLEHAFQYSHIQCDLWCIMSTVVYGCICGACFLILTYPEWWMVYYEHCCIWLHLWSMHSNAHIQCDGLCIMNTVLYGCISRACFLKTLRYPVWCMDGTLWTLLYMVASVSVEHAFQ